SWQRSNLPACPEVRYRASRDPTVSGRSSAVKKPPQRPKKRNKNRINQIGSLWTPDEYGKHIRLGKVDNVDMSDLQEFRDKYSVGVDMAKEGSDKMRAQIISYDYETAQRLFNEYYAGP